MKKILTLLAVLAIMFVGINNTYAQNPDDKQKNDTTTVQQNTTNVVEDQKEQQAQKNEEALHNVLKTKFIEGGPEFMGVILLTLILGLAIALERVIYLTLAQINTKKFIEKVENALNEGGIEAAKEVCRNTRGPIASIYYQGLMHYDQGIDVVERTVSTYGGVQMGLLEKGLTWISLFIALAPMLGFMGTVIGMVQAFDAIEKAGDISPTVVAAGIKVALLTTVFGLIVAIILQLFYNYLVSKVDTLVTQMEDASVTLVDMLYKFNLKK